MTDALDAILIDAGRRIPESARVGLRLPGCLLGGAIGCKLGVADDAPGSGLGGALYLMANAVDAILVHVFIPFYFDKN